MSKRLLFAATTASLLAACGDASTLDIGDQKAQLGTTLTDYATQWDGYAQAFTFPGDETDRVRIDLDEEGNGTIRFGNEELFPAATDPDDWYPPTYLGDDLESGLNLAGVRSGFAFPIVGAVVHEARLKFEFDPDALMQSWCALQANAPFESFTCSSELGFAIEWSKLPTEEPACSYQYGDPPTLIQISCPRAVQCYSTCSCDESGCSATRSDNARFDAVLTDEGAILEGTLVIPSLDNARVTVVMSQ